MARIRTVKPEFWPANKDASPFRCTLYLIAEIGTGFHKIGMAAHPIRRLSSLQCGNPRRLELLALYEGERGDCLRIERASRRFFGIAKNTEWFTPNVPGSIVPYLESFVDDGADA